MTSGSWRICLPLSLFLHGKLGLFQADSHLLDTVSCLWLYLVAFCPSLFYLPLPRGASWKLLSNPFSLKLLPQGLGGTQAKALIKEPGAKVRRSVCVASHHIQFSAHAQELSLACSVVPPTLWELVHANRSTDAFSTCPAGQKRIETYPKLSIICFTFTDLVCADSIAYKVLHAGPSSCFFWILPIKQ